MNLLTSALETASRWCMTSGLPPAMAETIPRISGEELFTAEGFHTFVRYYVADGPLSLSAQLGMRGHEFSPAPMIGSNETGLLPGIVANGLNSVHTAGGTQAALHNALADGTFSNLSWAQDLWLKYWTFCGSDQAVLTWTYAIMNVFYVLFALAFAGVDYSGVWTKRRLQPEPERWPGISHYWACLKNLLQNYILVILPIVFFAHPILRFLDFKSNLDLPSLPSALAQLAFFVWAEDFTHYWLHRALHLKWIYPYIHKIHHKWSTPFGLAASYAHPIEVFVLGFCTFSGPLLLASHYSLFCMWIIYRQLDAVFTHCGYDIPGIGDFLPYYGGTPAHDLHHRTFNCNYSSRFTYLDIMFGTFHDPDAEHDRLVKKMKPLGNGDPFIKEWLDANPPRLTGVQKSTKKTQ